MKVFEEVRDALSWRDVAEEDPEKGGKQKSFFYCEVHGDEETADLQVHQDGAGKCHSCGEYFYDLINYVAERDYKGDNWEAAKYLIEEHNLDINLEEDLSEEEKERRKKQQEVYEVLEDAVNRAQDKLRDGDIERLQNVRDWDNETIENCRLGRMDEELFRQLQDEHGEEMVEKAGIHYGMTGMDASYCISIPHLKRNGQPYLTTGMIPKQLRNRTKDSTPKYQQAKSSDHISNDIYRLQNNRSDTIIITEGYPDAISAADHGYDTIAAGCGSFKGNYDKLKQAVQSYGKAVVVTDKDDTGEENLEKTAEKISKQTPTYIYKFEDENKGYDLDDWTSEDNTVDEIVEGSTEFIVYLKEEYKEADRVERIEIKNTVFRIIDAWSLNQRQEAISDFCGRDTLAKQDFRDSFKEWQKNKVPEDIELTEPSEVTEAAEPDTSEESSMGELERLSKQKPKKGKRPVGRIDDTLFLTAWVSDKGREYPIIITSNEVWSKVKYKLKEVRKQRKKQGKDEELSEEEKERYDYYYAKINGEEVEFRHEIPQKCLANINNLDNRVLQYITGEKQPRDKEELWNAVKEKFEEYWAHYHQEWYDIAIGYAAHTYLLPVIGNTFYIVLKGIKGTGKSQFQKTISRLSYNGVWAGNLTAVTAPRVAHAYMADTHIDEFEKKEGDELKKLQKLLNSAYQKEGKYIQSNTDGTSIEDQITILESFSPKTLSANKLHADLYDSFMDRVIVLKSAKANREIKDVDEIDDNEEESFNQLQAEFGYFILQHWKEIKEEIDQAKEDIDESNREEKKLAIYQGIVTYFLGEDEGKAVADRIRDSKELEGTEKIKETDRAILEGVIEEFAEQGSESVKIPLTELRDRVNNTVLEGNNEYQKTSSGVSDTLEEYDLLIDPSQKERGSETGGYTVELDFSKTVEGLERNELMDLRGRLLKLEGSLEEDSDDESGSVASEVSVASEEDTESGGKPSPKAVKEAVKETQEEQNEMYPSVGKVTEKLKQRNIYDEELVEKAMELDTEGSVLNRLVNQDEIYTPDKGKLSFVEW